MPLQLYPFQEAGVNHLYRQRSRLIGDDMGVGKTVQGIAIDLRNRRDAANKAAEMGQVPRKRKTLIVAPASVLPVWENHLRDWAPQHDVYVIDRKRRGPFIKAALDPKKDGYFVCNWESLRLKDMAELQRVRWFHILADEVHRAKNRKSQQTQALKKLKTVFKTGMSGTPADNKPQDLWSVLNWLWPGYYTAYWPFFHKVCISEYKRNVSEDEDEDDTGYHKVTDINKEGVKELLEEMRPWYIRRKKSDVLKDLPDKYYTNYHVELTPQQRRAYNEMQNNMTAWVKDHQAEIEAESPMMAGQIVAQLQRLQQFAIANMAQDGWVKVRKRNKRTGEVTEEIKPKFIMTEPSSKLDTLMDIIDDNEREQIIVFSQFKQPIQLLAKRLQTRGIPYGTITGDSSQADRGRVVEDFQASKLHVVAGTIGAGGVGITLTASSTVVFLDRAWSPALNAQAEDRAHRIGQKNAVQIIDIVARKTVDRSRMMYIDQKWEWLEQLFGDEPTLKHIQHILARQF